MRDLVQVSNNYTEGTQAGFENEDDFAIDYNQSFWYIMAMVHGATSGDAHCPS